MSSAGKKKRCAYLSASPSVTPNSSSNNTPSTSTPQPVQAPTTPAEALLSPPPPPVQCSSAALRMVGHCPHCDRTYCAKHRLPEDHKCLGLEGIKGRAFEMNKEKLEREAKEAARGPVAAV